MENNNAQEDSIQTEEIEVEPKQTNRNNRNT